MVHQPLNLAKSSFLSAPAARAFGPKTPTDIPSFTQTSSPPRIMGPRQRRRATAEKRDGSAQEFTAAFLLSSDSHSAQSEQWTPTKGLRKMRQFV
ncbi:hypothetical protein FCOIX_6075 [Fusarium coicis]|nr:hypothetical protein FCOIX_6075 [Fusarium coicis]